MPSWNVPPALATSLAERYSLEREIGRGGMASVYLAHDVRHDRPVALKVLHAHLAAAIGADRFHREIQVVARLRHPHIVPLYDSGEAAGHLFYVMPYVQGESVRERLKRAGPFSSADALRLVREMADALDYAHQQGVIHRDIKPDNVMLDDRHALLADFGIARALSTENATALTETGLLVGTPAYMSPEQITGERELDGRSDLYSLGCVLYEMVSGKPPFVGPTAQAVMAQRFSGLAPAEADAALVPPPVARILTTALQVTPATRFQSARAMGDALEQAHDELRGAGDYFTPARTVKPAVRARRVVPWIVGIAVVGTIATLGALKLLGNRTPAAPAAPAVGVLPFANRSANREMEYFSDGITDELITALSRVPGLQVAGRTSSFSLKNKGLDAQQSAERLKARYVIDGSVRSDQSAVRVTWQLIDGTNGRGVGSGEFDGEMRNVIALQDSLARVIVDKLRPMLGGVSLTTAPRHSTANFEAHDLYLRGHYYWNQRTPETMRTGISYLKQAIEKDPNYALAYAELSSAYTLEPAFGDMRPSEVMGLAREAAQQAFRLDSTLSEAYTALGMSSTFNDWEWPKALTYMDKAVALDSTNAFPHLFRAWPLVMLGRVNEALSELEKARALDPLSPIVNTRYGTTLIYAGRPNDAVTALRATVANDPGNLLARFELGRALAQVGRYDEAFREFPDAIDAEAGYAMGWLGWAYGKAGRPDDARAVLRRLQARAAERYMTPEGIALAALGAGDTTLALDQLERGLRDHAIYMVFLKADPMYEALRHQPRVQEVIRKMRF